MGRFFFPVSREHDPAYHKYNAQCIEKRNFLAQEKPGQEYGRYRSEILHDIKQGKLYFVHCFEPREKRHCRRKNREIKNNRPCGKCNRHCMRHRQYQKQYEQFKSAEQHCPGSGGIASDSFHYRLAEDRIYRPAAGRGKNKQISGKMIHLIGKAFHRYYVNHKETAEKTYEYARNLKNGNSFSYKNTEKKYDYRIYLHDERTVYGARRTLSQKKQRAHPGNSEKRQDAHLQNVLYLYREKLFAHEDISVEHEYGAAYDETYKGKTDRVYLIIAYEKASAYKCRAP